MMLEGAGRVKCFRANRTLIRLKAIVGHEIYGKESYRGAPFPSCFSIRLNMLINIYLLTSLSDGLLYKY
jgi:hypothetical protein